MYSLYLFSPVPALHYGLSTCQFIYVLVRQGDTCLSTASFSILVYVAVGKPSFHILR